MRDGAAFTRRKVPVVVFVTAQFASQAEAVGRAAGVTGLPVVVLPHPMATRGEDELAAVAREVAGAVVAGLAGPGVAP